MTKQQAIDNIKARLNQSVYDICADEMSKLEYADEWWGNSHHAAQYMHVLITQETEPILAKAISAMVFRDEDKVGYDRVYAGVAL